MVFVHVLLEAAKTSKSIQGFVEGGDLVNVLSTLGDVEYAAARDAVANAALSRDPKGPLWAAVGHLQSAHMAYRGVYAGRGGLKAYLGALTNTIALNKDLFTLCLMAVCYRYLGEPGLTRHALDLAAEPMREWAALNAEHTLGEVLTDAQVRGTVLKALAQGMAGMLNAGNWAAGAKLSGAPLPDITEAQFAEFSRLMLAAEAPDAGKPGKTLRAAKCRECGRRRKLSEAGLCRECGASRG